MDIPEIIIPSMEKQASSESIFSNFELYGNFDLFIQSEKSSDQEKISQLEQIKQIYESRNTRHQIPNAINDKSFQRLIVAPKHFVSHELFKTPNKIKPAKSHGQEEKLIKISIPESKLEIPIRKLLEEIFGSLDLTRVDKSQLKNQILNRIDSVLDLTIIKKN
jgi:hypothetical protein